MAAGRREEVRAGPRQLRADPHRGAGHTQSYPEVPLDSAAVLMSTDPSKDSSKALSKDSSTMVTMCPFVPSSGALEAAGAYLCASRTPWPLPGGVFLFLN